MQAGLVAGAWVAASLCRVALAALRETRLLGFGGARRAARARVDVCALDGGVYVRTSGAADEVVSVIPPIIEESHEPGGRTVSIIDDGIHRVFAARSLGCRSRP